MFNGAGGRAAIVDGKTYQVEKMRGYSRIEEAGLDETGLPGEGQFYTPEARDRHDPSKVRDGLRPRGTLRPRRTRTGSSKDWNGRGKEADLAIGRGLGDGIQVAGKEHRMSNLLLMLLLLLSPDADV